MPRLTLGEKLEIINQLGHVSQGDLAQNYSVHPRAITKIKKKEDFYQQFSAKENLLGKRKIYID